MRTQDTATAQGLRQHSIGPAFPAIVVGRGVNPTLWYVHLGSHVSGEWESAARAEEFANIVGSAHHEHGFEVAAAIVEDDAEIALRHNLKKAYQEAHNENA